MKLRADVVKEVSLHVQLGNDKLRIGGMARIGWEEASASGKEVGGGGGAGHIERRRTSRET